MLCGPLDPHYTRAPENRQHSGCRCVPVFRRNPESLLAKIIHMRNEIGLRIYEPNDCAVLIGVLHFKGPHRPPGPEPVTQRLQAVRNLVVRVSAMSVPAWLERLRGLIVSVQALSDSLRDGIADSGANGQHILGSEGPQDPTGARDFSLERHSVVSAPARVDSGCALLLRSESHVLPPP